MVAEVSLQRVGIILCLEASRLSRNSKDWAQLFELCGYAKTLVADGDQVYDLSIPNDRLLLGLKGTVSESELALLRQRSAEAIDAKAKRGELQFSLPVGLCWNDGKVELAIDQRIQQAIRMVFDKFGQLGSARQVLIWWRDHDLSMPARGLPGGTGRSNGVRRPTGSCCPSCAIHSTPARRYGRTGSRTRLVEGRATKTRARKPAAEWRVLIVEHHKGYISWEQFEHNQRVLAENAFMTGTRARKSARGGRCLLAGLLRCARCGHMLHVAYGRGHEGRYECRQMNKARAAPRCIAFTARRIDEGIRAAVINAVQGQALQAAIEAAAMMGEQVEQQRSAVALELEQARYEAQLARRRYESVDPQQRLVAAELEARWNATLQRVEELEQRLEATTAASTIAKPVDRRTLESLAQDLEMVWDTTDAMPLKQRIVRLLMQEIVADIDTDKAEIVLLIHWVGGRHTELRVARTRVGEHGNATSQDADAIVRSMAGQWSDADLAATLNRLGLRTGVGNTWTTSRVLSVRKRLGLVDFDPALVKPMLTLNQAGDELESDHGSYGASSSSVFSRQSIRSTAHPGESIPRCSATNGSGESLLPCARARSVQEAERVLS